MNTEPLRNYIKGVEAYKAGFPDEALDLISSAVGADRPTGFMIASLDKLVDSNDAILALILHESTKA